MNRSRVHCYGEQRCRFHRTGGSGTLSCSGVAYEAPPRNHGDALISALVSQLVPSSESRHVHTYLCERSSRFEQHTSHKYDASKVLADLARLRRVIDSFTRAIERGWV